MNMSHARSEYEDFRKLAPEAYEIVAALGQAAVKAGIDKPLLELIELRASQINGCAFAVSYPAGRAAWHGRRQAQSRGGLARGAAVFRASARRWHGPKR
jgi:alkylhydroperoxidase family enzyme